jgi:hypothetical protein
MVRPPFTFVRNTLGVECERFVALHGSLIAFERVRISMPFPVQLHSQFN